VFSAILSFAMICPNWKPSPYSLVFGQDQSDR